MNSLPIYFVAHHLRRRWPELQTDDAQVSLSGVPPARWAPGENIWIVSTYLRLRAAGANVRIVDKVQPGCINLYHEWEVIRSHSSHRAFLVYTQGDRADQPWADLTIAQSPAMLSTSRHHLIDMWPQPGLLPRDTARGQRVERIGYVGPLENLAAAYRTPQFQEQLRYEGVELVLRTDPAEWHDFRDLFLFIAVRDWPWALIRTKPSTKLVHAWMTGVPALLGPEPSYQYWGRSNEDYFEVRSPSDVLEIVKRLKREPEAYQAFQARGYAKASQHDTDAVLKQWIDLLAGPIEMAFQHWRAVGSRVWQYRAARRGLQRLSAPLWQKWFTMRSRGRRAFASRSRI